VELSSDLPDAPFWRRAGSKIMNKKLWLSLAVGGSLLTVFSGGGVYWMKRGGAPSLAMAGAAQTGEADPGKPAGEVPQAQAPSAAEPFKPIPAAASDLADLRAENASPGRFQPPVTAEPVTQAGATISDNQANRVGDAPPQPPSAFVPFGGPTSPDAGVPEASPGAVASANPAESGSAASPAGEASPAAPEAPATGLPQVPEPPNNASTSPDAAIPATEDLAAPVASGLAPPDPATAAPLVAAPIAAAAAAAPPEVPANMSPAQSPAASARSLPGRESNSLSAASGQALPDSGGGSPTPGPKELEGEQTPALSLEKIAPGEIQVGAAATFQTVVRNVGAVSANNVLVTDHVPKGTRLVSTSPQGTTSPNGSVVWQLGTLKPNDEVTVAMELIPETEGEIGSVAEVSFHSQASAKSLCTKPQLAVRHTAPAKVMIGDNVVLSIEISNPGSGAAKNVILEEDVPPGLVHPAGKELEYDVGTLQPNETRKLELPLAADGPGVLTNILRVRADGGLTAEHQLQVEILAPQIQVGVNGPARRYLERQVTYQVSVANPGTAAAKDIELIAYLPKGLKFMEADQQGQYDTQNHSVSWTVPELPPSQKGVVQITALPIEIGEQKLSVEGRAEMGLNHQAEHLTVVEGVTQLQFSVSDVQDPIEVQAETVYEVRVVNSGTKAATNVRLTAVFPAGMSPVSGEGPSRVAVQGQQATTDALPQLAPNAEAVYQIQASGTKAGDHVVRIQMTSDDSTTPVTKEESTRVYADE
jgi:uncharacterized repeat protein (TIGR01451 family)